MMIRILFALFVFICLPAIADDEGIKVVAVVNADVITNADISARVDMMMAMSGLENTPEIREKMRNQILHKLIDETLQNQEVKRRHIKVTETEMGFAYKQLAEHQNVPVEQLESKIKELGINPKVLDHQIETEMGWSKLIAQQLRPRINVTDSEINETIEAVSGDRGFDEWQIAEILLPVNTPSAADAAQKLADQLNSSIKSGADFDKLANQFKSPGGDTETRHWVNTGSLDPELISWLRKSDIGNVSLPIQTSAGLHIIKIYDKRRMLGADPLETEVALQQIILPATPEQGDDVARQRFEQAKEISKQITGCGNFAEMGKTIPDANVHNLGRLQLKHLSEEIRNIIAPLPVGQVSAPFRTPLGIHLMIICERISPRSVPIDRKQIKQTLEQKKLALEAMRLMWDLRRSAYIEVRGF